MHKFILIIALLGVIACGDKQNTQQPETEESAQSDPVLDSLNRLILSNPENPSHYTSRAEHFRSLGNDKAAMNDLERALRADSTYADAYHASGKLYFDLQDYESAYLAYGKCLEYAPNHREGLMDAAYMESLLGNFADAIKHINTVLKEDQYVPEAYYMKGQIYKQTGDTALAVSSYQTATEVKPEYYDAYLALALLYSAKQSPLAEEYFETALSLKPESTEALYGKAMYFQESSNGDTALLNKAFEIYDQILAIDEVNAAAAFNKGYIYLEYLSAEDDNAYQEAADWFSRAIEFYPMYYQAIYNRGLSYESMEMLDRAEKDYRKALAIQPDYEPAALALERVMESR